MWSVFTYAHSLSGLPRPPGSRLSRPKRKCHEESGSELSERSPSGNESKAVSLQALECGDVYRVKLQSGQYLSYCRLPLLQSFPAPGHDRSNRIHGFLRTAKPFRLPTDCIHTFKARTIIRSQYTSCFTRYDRVQAQGFPRPASCETAICDRIIRNKHCTWRCGHSHARQYSYLRAPSGFVRGSCLSSYGDLQRLDGTHSRRPCSASTAWKAAVQ